MTDPRILSDGYLNKIASSDPLPSMQELLDHIDALTEQLRATEFECIHCGMVSPDVTHWKRCIAHPARVRLERADAGLAEVLKALQCAVGKLEAIGVENAQDNCQSN